MTPKELNKIRKSAKKCGCDRCKEMLRVLAPIDDWTRRAAELQADILKRSTRTLNAFLADMAPFAPEGE